MNFTAIQNRVAEETGLDLSNTDDLASIQSWINQVYLHVSGIQNWDWLFRQGILQTLPDITSGTATVVANATAVTLSTTPNKGGSNVSVAGQWMINFPTVGADWYFISTHTVATTALVLSVPFVGQTNLTAGTYVLRKVLYSLPLDLDKVIDIRQQIAPQRLGYVDPRTFDALIPNPTATGTPRVYSLVGRYVPTGAWQVALYPVPGAILNLQVKYYCEVTELASGTDEPLLPKVFHDILVFGSLYFFGHPFIDDDRMASAKVRYKEAMDDMRANSKHVPDALTRLQPSDANTMTIRRYTLPDNYGV